MRRGTSGGGVVGRDKVGMKSGGLRGHAACVRDGLRRDKIIRFKLNVFQKFMAVKGKGLMTTLEWFFSLLLQYWRLLWSTNAFGDSAEVALTFIILFR